MLSTHGYQLYFFDTSSIIYRYSITCTHSNNNDSRVILLSIAMRLQQLIMHVINDVPAASSSSSGSKTSPTCSRRRENNRHVFATKSSSRHCRPDHIILCMALKHVMHPIFLFVSGGKDLSSIQRGAHV